jgi:hypothetical protein
MAESHRRAEVFATSRKALHVIVVGNNDMGWNWRSWGQYHKAEEAYMHQRRTKAPTQPRDLVNIYAIYQRSEL